VMRLASYSLRGALSSNKDLCSYRPRDCLFDAAARKRQRELGPGFPDAGMLSLERQRIQPGRQRNAFHVRPSLPLLEEMSLDRRRPNR